VPPRYLLDTHTLSYFIKGTYPGVRSELTRKPPSLLAISAITEAELRYWVANRPEQARLRILIDDFVTRIPSLPWDAAAAEAYGPLKAKLKLLGKPLAGLDLLITSQAIALNTILVSHDQAFRQIPNLLTEDWV
jgi:predicted nucleic acid-binding protein